MICNIFYLLQPSHQPNSQHGRDSKYKNSDIEDMKVNKTIISCLSIYWLFVIISVRETLHSLSPQ